VIAEAEADPSDDDDDAIDFIEFDKAAALLLLGRDVTLFACLPLFYIQNLLFMEQNVFCTEQNVL
jgi:hypothetical protein